MGGLGRRVIWTHAAAALVAIVLGFAGGWHTRAWKAGADDAQRLQSEQSDRAQMAARVDRAAAGNATRTAAIRAEVRTITREVERVVSQPVYIDRPCLDPDGLRLVARAAGAASAADPGEPAPAVPGAASAR